MTHDDDAPGIRLWGDSRLERGIPVKLPDTATKPNDPLQSLSQLARPLQRMRTSEDAPEVRSEHRLNLQVLTDEGQPLEVDLTVMFNGDTEEQSLRTNADGRLDIAAPEGAHWIRFANAPIALPPHDPAAAPRTGTVFVGRDADFELSAAPTGAPPKTVLVRRPGVVEYVLDGWAQGSKVMRWGGASERVGPDGRPRVGTARAWLREALWTGKMREMIAVGHADPLGQDSDNNALALERARSVYLYASGDLDGFAEHAAANATEVDFDCALVAFSRIVGAPVALGDKDGMKRSLAHMATWAGQPVTTKAEQWRVIADAYDHDLSRIMGLELAGLASLRSLQRWAGEGFMSAGERHPRPEVELALRGKVPDARAHRRVSLCIFGGADGAPWIADDHVDEIYDGTYARTTIEAAAEVPVVIRVIDAKRDAIPAGRAWVQLGAIGVRELVADEGGQIHFTTLDGDRVAVVCAVDDRRGGTVLDAGQGEP